MGKLAHIQAQMGKSAGIDGVFKPIVEHITQAVVNRLSESLERGGEGLHSIKSTLGAIEPSIKAHVAALVAELSEALVVQQSEVKTALSASQKAVTDTQRAIMQTVAGLKFPDHSEQLHRIEGKNVDLSPLERQIEAVMLKMHMEEERPTEWTFHVERDKRGLITEVTATAEE